MANSYFFVFEKRISSWLRYVNHSLPSKDEEICNKIYWFKSSFVGLKKALGDSIVRIVKPKQPMWIRGRQNLFCAPSLKLGRIETLAQSDAFTIITMKMSPEGDLRQRLNHHFIESIDFIFLLRKHGRLCGKVRFQSCSVNLFYLLPWNRERDRSAFIIG